MNLLTETEIVDGLKLGLFSRIVGTDVLLESLSQVSDHANEKILPIVHQVLLQIEDLGARLTPDPLTGQINQQAGIGSAYSHSCEALIRWMDLLLVAKSPLWDWYEFGVLAAEIIRSEELASTLESKSDSNSKKPDELLSKLERKRKRFVEKFERLKGLRPNFRDLLQELTSHYPSLKRLSTLVEHLPEGGDLGVEAHLARLFAIAEKRPDPLTDFDRAVVTALVQAGTAVSRDTLRESVNAINAANNHPVIEESAFRNRMPELVRRRIVVSSRSKPFGYTLGEWSR